MKGKAERVYNEKEEKRTEKHPTTVENLGRSGGSRQESTPRAFTCASKKKKKETKKQLSTSRRRPPRVTTTTLRCLEKGWVPSSAELGATNLY